MECLEWVGWLVVVVVGRLLVVGVEVAGDVRFGHVVVEELVEELRHVRGNLRLSMIVIALLDRVDAICASRNKELHVVVEGPSIAYDLDREYLKRPLYLFFGLPKTHDSRPALLPTKTVFPCYCWSAAGILGVQPGTLDILGLLHILAVLLDGFVEDTRVERALVS